MINWISEIPTESIVLIEGVVGASEWEIKGASVKDMEIKGEKASGFVFFLSVYLAYIFDSFIERTLGSSHRIA